MTACGPGADGAGATPIPAATVSHAIVWTIVIAIDFAAFTQDSPRETVRVDGIAVRVYQRRTRIVLAVRIHQPFIRKPSAICRPSSGTGRSSSVRFFDSGEIERRMFDMRVDDLLMTIIIGGIGFSGVHLRAEFVYWRKSKAEELRRRASMRQIFKSAVPPAAISSSP